MDNESTLSLPEIEDRIAIVRDNLRQLSEQAAAASGAANEALASDRINDQQAELDRLSAMRDAILAKRAAEALFAAKPATTEAAKTAPKTAAKKTVKAAAKAAPKKKTAKKKASKTKPSAKNASPKAAKKKAPKKAAKKVGKKKRR